MATSHAAPALTTGFALKNSQVIGNMKNGVEFDGVTATDVTIKSTDIAANTRDGVFIHDTNIGDAFASSFTDFVIEDSYLGEVRDTMGTLLFAGNQQNGFVALDTTLTGVAFLNSFFNRNGLDGIIFAGSTIIQGMVTPHAGTPITTGFKLEGSQVIGNTGNGVEFNRVTATDVSIKSTDIAANTLNGVAVFGGSNFHDFKIQDLHLGAVGMLAGNGQNGFNAQGSTFTGAAFLDSPSTGTVPARMAATASFSPTARSTPGPSPCTIRPRR